MLTVRVSDAWIVPATREHVKLGKLVTATPHAAASKIVGTGFGNHADSQRLNDAATILITIVTVKPTKGVSAPTTRSDRVRILAVGVRKSAPTVCSRDALHQRHDKKFAVMVWMKIAMDS